MNYLYLIKSQEFYKIGIATDPQSRIAQLQTGNPYELEIFTCYAFDDASVVERAIHQVFKDDRVQGEWFGLRPEQIQKFEDLCLMLGGNYAEEFIARPPSDAEIIEAEEMAEPLSSGKWDYSAMFADGWRIEPSSSRGKNGVYWAWRKQDNGKRPYIYGGLVSELPYPMHEMKNIYGCNQKE